MGVSLGVIRRILLGTLVLTALVHGAAWACSCVASGYGTADMVDDFDLVVWGEVLSVRSAFVGCGPRSSMDPVNVRIEVIDGFAGVSAGDVVTVHTPSSGASCGIEFQPGSTWLIFAQDDRDVSL